MLIWVYVACGFLATLLFEGMRYQARNARDSEEQCCRFGIKSKVAGHSCYRAIGIERRASGIGSGCVALSQFLFDSTGELGMSSLKLKLKGKLH